MIIERTPMPCARPGWVAPRLLAATAAFGAPALAQAQWVPPYWAIDRAGLTSAEYTDSTGFQRSNWVASGSAGQVVGWSYRYNGSAGTGQSAWVWNKGDGTLRIGLTDAGYTAADGSRNSAPRAVGGDGRVVGVSSRYNGAASAGQSAWMWTAATGTTRLGFTDTAHTATDGSQYSEARGLNDTGRAIGSSYRYSGASFVGMSAWTWASASGLLRIGFTDSTHTSSTGAQYSDTVAVNNSGQVIGSSKRYVNAFERGESAWVWTSAGGATRIGLLDSAHTATTGQQTSRPTGLSSSGQVMGTSARYVGTAYTGDSAWTWTSTLGTVRIGLNDGTTNRDSTAIAMNSTGGVIGRSSLAAGPAAWVWSSTGGSVRLGYTDAVHTGSAGYQYSLALRLSETGAVIGFSARYLGGNDAGGTAWLWTSSGGLVPLGFTDGMHTRSDGYQNSWPAAINAAGQVVGYSERYNNGTTWLGNTGWFYDPATGVTTPLVFSIATGGAVNTSPTLLTDSGWVLGNYMLYSGETQVGYHAFAWSLARGFTELGSLVNGGLASAGWSVLSQPVSVREFRSVVGSGAVTGLPPGSDAVFVLTAPAAACNLADITGIGGPPAVPDGLLTGDDFNAFISAFAADDLRADITGIGGPPAVPDGLITGDDFNAFIAGFAAGCP